MKRRHFLAATAGTCLSAPWLAAQDSTPPSEGGIGGTGIVGILTDLGSLIVAGRRVETTNRTRFVNAFGAARESDIGIGTALTVEAVAQGGALVAQRVLVSYPLIGTLMQDGSVNGIRVIAEPGAVGRPAPGTVVAVSGVWRDGAVVASRFDRITGAPYSVIAGDILRDADGSWRIGTARLTLPFGARPTAGTYVTALGSPETDGFTVRRQSAGRFGRRAVLGALAVEGYLRPAPAAPGYRLAGLGHSFDEGAQLQPFHGHRALFTGPYVQTFEVSRGLILPERLDQRRAAMRDVLAGQATFRPAR
ncbi:DUF5666 domain-containing protein [Aestuariibius insulae]|uniref:DUF5666 domain-containing protein n=1 Tax=Aestuariibius insulae TaxID=2058287 RepID=UPI00345E0E53